MQRMFGFLLLACFFPLQICAGTCDKTFENTSQDLWEIILYGDIDCLESFLPQYTENNKDVLNELFGKEACSECSDTEKILALGTTPCQGDTPLICAAKFHDLPMMKMLINVGADINAQNKDKNTALMVSVSNKYSYYIDALDVSFNKALIDFYKGLSPIATNKGYDLQVSGFGPVFEKNPVLRLERAGRTDIDLEKYFTYRNILLGGMVYDDIVNFLLDNGADANILNEYGENAFFIAFSASPAPFSGTALKKLQNKTNFNDLVSARDGQTILTNAYCHAASYTNMVNLFDAGYDKNKQRQDGKNLCEIVSYDDFKSYRCEDFECNANTKGKVLPCKIPNGQIDFENCVDKRNGTKICDGTKWSECSFERGDNKCKSDYEIISFCETDEKTLEYKCCESPEKRSSTNTNSNVLLSKTTEILDNGNKNLDEIEEANAQYLQKLKQKYEEAKANEQSLANRMLTALTVAATGIGGMELARGLAEQQADKEAEASMNAYIETMRCTYGDGKQVKAGPDEIELPGGNNETLMKLRAEYFALAADLKERKTALGMKPGIESEEILDKSQTGLYDDENTGIESGAYESLYRAQMMQSDVDQAKINENADTSKKRVIGGGVAAGAGVIGGTVGNAIINRKSDEQK